MSGWICSNLIALAILMPVIFRGWRWFTLTANRRAWQWLRSVLGWGSNVAELARRLDYPLPELLVFEPRYQQVSIRKRSGGSRLLQVPDRETKKLQRRILDRLLSRLRVHAAARGFERGKSIVDHAAAHVGQAVVVRMDIVDFFPTTQARRIEWYFRRIGWDRAAAGLLVKLTCWADGLPQGAPTSPRLSNLVNYYLDVQLSNKMRRRKCTYTRYADDITVSCPKDYPKRVRGIIQLVRRKLKSKGYQLHERKKLHIRRRHQQQLVTGLVVNERVQLPRRVRRWLRAVRHHQQTGRAVSLAEQQLRGWLAFAAMVEKQGRDRSKLQDDDSA